MWHKVKGISELRGGSAIEHIHLWASVWALRNRSPGDFLMMQWLRLCTPKVRGPGSSPVWGTRSHMPRLNIPHPATMTWHSQINKQMFFKKEGEPQSYMDSANFSQDRPSYAAVTILPPPPTTKIYLFDHSKSQIRALSLQKAYRADVLHAFTYHSRLLCS